MTDGELQGKYDAQRAMQQALQAQIDEKKRMKQEEEQKEREQEAADELRLVRAGTTRASGVVSVCVFVWHVFTTSMSNTGSCCRFVLTRFCSPDGMSVLPAVAGARAG